MSDSGSRMAIQTVPSPTPAAVQEPNTKLHREDIVEEAEKLLLSSMKADADVLVIGGGPGGYVAAIRATQLGGRVILVEGREMGGTCLNRGCIPTKAMLESVATLHAVKKAREFGIECGEAKADFGKIMNRVQRVVKQLRSGVEYLMQKNQIQVIRGWARLTRPHTVQVLGADGGEQVFTARNIIIATGSSPAILPVPGSDAKGVLTSDTILELTTLPESLAVIGAGAVGIEFGQIFASLGVRVTVLEMLPRILPLFDADISADMTKILQKGGMKLQTNARVTAVAETTEGVKVTYETTNPNDASAPTGTGEVIAQYVLSAAGRRANVDNLGLESIGIVMERSRPVVDECMQTNLPGVYAVGDVVRGEGLAHWASAEGIVAAENAMGRHSEMRDRPVPGCVFTEPEIATVGLTESEAREARREVLVGKFSLRVLGKSVAAGVREGFVKVVADAEYQRILGVHILGARATDLIAEATLALQFGATLEELADTIHAHPTFAEAMGEAAHAARGEAIHGA